MTLLREVMERPLDPGYAVAARRRAEGASPTRRGIVVTLVLALVCGALTARAIAVNGQRLTARTAIRYAGQAILVDFRPLVPPYVVSAVGDPSGLQTRFAAGSAGEYLQALRDNYGVRAAIVSSANLELPGAGGFSTRFVHASSAASATPSPSASAPGSSGTPPS